MRKNGELIMISAKQVSHGWFLIMDGFLLLDQLDHFYLVRFEMKDGFVLHNW